MKPSFDSHTNIFKLSNGKVDYLIYINKLGIPVHLYFGKSLKDFNSSDFLKQPDYNYQFYKDNHFETIDHYYETITPVEISTNNSNDLRPSSISIEHGDNNLLDFRFIGFETVDIEQSEEIPHARALSPSDCILKLKLKDIQEEIYLDLYYRLLNDSNVLIRKSEVINKTGKTIYIDKLASATIDVPFQQQELIHFEGSWANERNYIKESLNYGLKMLYSLEGRSGHSENPFFIVKNKETTENFGACYGFNLIYSGNFANELNVNNYNSLRINTGINPTNFHYSLKDEERFLTPEAILTYSSSGLNELSQTNHRFVREHILSKEQREKQNKIVFNSWEGAGMNFNTDSIIDYAKKAKEIGAEIFVLDDGWFSTRNDDQHGLGDWYINENKINLKKVEEEVHKLGMGFGIWIEPECVNIDTKLFKEHPDYALGKRDRVRKFGRNQLVLDFSRKEVFETILNEIKASLKNIKIDYIKYDMNRTLGDIYSYQNPQGEVFHKYVLGVYHFMDCLLKAFPTILFENCSSGGGRFDLGMLYFSPQIWASDETNPMRRLFIQYGTSYGYPLSCISSHVSKAYGSYQTKANVAFFGTYGYEMDPRTLSQEEIQLLAKYTNFYHAVHHEMINEGTFYRLLSPFETKFASFLCVNKEKTKALFLYHSFFKQVNACQYIKLEGLNPDFEYEINGEKFSGSYLMNVGLNFSQFKEADTDSLLFLKKVEEE